MTLAIRLIASLVVALLGATPRGAPAQATPAQTARVIVAFKAQSSLARVDKSLTESATRSERAKALASRTKIALGAGPSVSERAQVMTATGVSADELARRLSEDSDVEYAVPDQRRHPFDVPNDPLYVAGPAVNGPSVGQWYLRAPTGDIKSSVNATPAWSITVAGPNIVVADVDTGVRFEHPDLGSVADGGNLLPGYDMISDPAVANDGDGRDPDASDSGDWVTQAELAQRSGAFFQCTPAPERSSWHGTQVAGLIAALTDNNIGMASVARTVRLLPVRAIGKCGGFDSDIIAGMRWAAGVNVPGVPANPTPARVINLSLGSEGRCTAAYQAAVNEITAVGAVIVASAGNSAGHAVGVPANCNGVIAVAGLRHAGSKVGFSDLGPEIALSAPAGNCVNTAAGSPCLYPILTTTNTGTQESAAATYTDGLSPSLGTSFAAPLVSGTAALMLAVQPTLTPQAIKQILQATARAFPTTGADNGDGRVVPQCTAPRYDIAQKPIDQLQCYCTTNTCGAGMLDTWAAVLAASTRQPVASAQFEGLWWNSPAGSESGWGLNIAQQGDVLFVTWFTYDATGKPWWLAMTANRVAPSTYAGTLYTTRGPPFTSPFDASQVVASSVGHATLTFSDANDGAFTYTINGLTQTKVITRQVFGDVPTCTFALQPDVSTASSYQDAWWAAPAGSESGWGLSVVEQSNVIFAVWYTYDVDGSPLWLSVVARAGSSSSFSGTLYRTTGPAFNAVPFDPAKVVATPVGAATLDFDSGNAGRFGYALAGVSQMKRITREVFSGLGTTCR